jgi:hypothetical protein
MAIKDLLQHSGGKAVGVGFALLAIGFMAWMLLVPDAASSMADDTNYRIFIDADGNSFRHRVTVGEETGPKGPTGKEGFPAELCYWTKDGKPKSTPTAVLMNTFKGKPEPTFCPDCDRLVRPLNPPADLGAGQTAPVPPTRQEWEARRNK